MSPEREVRTFCSVMMTFLPLISISGARGCYEPCVFRIFGGEGAEENEFSSLAYVRAYKYNEIKKTTSRVYCGGIIISDKWVLSAGHCLTDSYTLFVGVGSNDRSKAKYIEAERFIVHKNLTIHGRNHNNAKDDVGLIKLKDSIGIDFVSTSTARLASEDKDVPTTSGAVVVGWGRVTYKPAKPGLESPKILQKLRVKIIPCPGAIENVICISSQEGTGICDGDSGGPLFVNTEVYGIASYVDNVNPDLNLDPNKHCTDAGTWAVYMSVPKYRTWIRENSGV